LPFGIAPTGFTRLLHTDGELAGAAAAHKAGIPFTLATMGTTSIEDVAAVESNLRKWFQLYLWRDREKSLALIERAQNAGFDTLMLTVDTPVAGLRLRDARNGMAVPPAISLRTIADVALHPAWWLNFVSTRPPSFASLSNFSGELADLVNAMYDPSLCFDDVKWIRNEWKGQLLIKGIQSVRDAQCVMELGADGVVLSNHGGRQLDRAPVPFVILPQVRKALGEKAQIILDSGIRSGGDIVAALAAGASFTLIGRAYLYGLMAGGVAGVSRAIEILTREITTTMQLMGVSSVAELCPDHINMAWSRWSGPLAKYQTTLVKDGSF
jgi:L-lactate dehydrogenase (cytochrome)